jgi:anti-sigma regulatory factor (Ser/Thr protein kinase)
MENHCDYSTLTIPNDRTYAPIAAAYVTEVARKIGFESHDRESLARAVEDVLTAIMERAFEPHERASIEVSCERVPLGLKVTIADQGIPFEPNPITACKLDEGPALQPLQGTQICLARGLVDDVEFHNLGSKGKETVLIKHLTNLSITGYYEACELEPYASQEHVLRPAEPAVQIDVRPFRPSDAVEVSRCVYRSYGYTYGYEHLYFPERIVQLNESGKLFSVVAVTSTNELAGHAALVWPDPPSRTGEMSMAVVKPEFRSHGILNRMTDYLLQKVRSASLVGVFGRAVTNHTFSQQVGLRMGMRDCGLQLGFVPADVTFKGITEKLSHRDTALVHFMYLDKPGLVRLCVPEHHRDMILRLYGNVDMSSEFEERSQSHARCAEGPPLLNTGAYGRLSFAHIDVVRYGRDVVGEVKSRLRELCVNRFEVIHLYLNLHDSCTCLYTEAFEGLGFFFSGILPGVFPGDALVLQYLNNVAIDYDRLHIHSQEGRDLCNYVRKRDPNTSKSPDRTVRPPSVS